MTDSEPALPDVTDDALKAAIVAGRPPPPGRINGQALSGHFQDLIDSTSGRGRTGGPVIVRVRDTLFTGDVRLSRRSARTADSEGQPPLGLLLGAQADDGTTESNDERPTAVVGDVVLIVGRRPVILELDGCVITGTVEVAVDHVHQLTITRSELRNGLKLAGAHVEGDLDLGGTKKAFLDTASSTLEGRILEGPAVDTRDVPDPMDDPTLVAIDADDDASTETPFPWDTVTQVVGLAAALAAWIAVVGGARFWARASNLEVPPIPLLAGAGQEWLLTEGLQALTLPVVLAAAVGLGVYFGISDDELPRSRAARRGALVRRLRESPELWLLVVAVLVALTLAASWQALLALKVGPQVVVGAVALAGAAAGVIAARGQGWWLIALSSLAGLWLAFAFVLGVWTVTVGWLVTMALFTTVVALVAALALTRSGRRGTALAIAAAIVIWSGALGFFYEAGARYPEETWARVTLTDATVMQGMLIARSESRLYLARNSARPADDEARVVEVIDNQNVADLEFASADVWDEPSSGAKDQDGGGTEPGDSGFSGGSTSGGGGGQSAPAPVETEDTDVAVTADLGGATVQVETRRLAVRDRFIALDLAIINTSDKPLVIGTLLSDSQTDDLSSIELVDTRDRWAYPVARHDDGICVCSTGLDRPLDPDQWRYLTALFRLPEPLPESVDVRMSGVPWIRGVPVE